MQEVDGRKNISLDIEAAKLLYDFKYKTVMEAAGKLTQLSLLMFSISSLITAAALLSNSDDESRKIVLYCVAIFMVSFSISGIAIIYGVLTGVLQMRETLRSMSSATFEILKMDAYFIRGYRVLIVVALSNFIGLVAVFSMLFFRM